jgi:hypothetical protein
MDLHIASPCCEAELYHRINKNGIEHEGRLYGKCEDVKKHRYIECSECGRPYKVRVEFVPVITNVIIKVSGGRLNEI